MFSRHLWPLFLGYLAPKQSVNYIAVKWIKGWHSTLDKFAFWPLFWVFDGAAALIYQAEAAQSACISQYSLSKLSQLLIYKSDQSDKHQSALSQLHQSVAVQSVICCAISQISVSCISQLLCSQSSISHQTQSASVSWLVAVSSLPVYKTSHLLSFRSQPTPSPPCQTPPGTEEASKWCRK